MRELAIKFTVALCLAVVSKPAVKVHAAVPFESQEFGFSLTIPAGMKAADLTRIAVSPEFVGLLLVPDDGDFPTFNVVARPYMLPDPAPALPVSAQAVLESYRRLGLTDAALRASSFEPVGSHPSRNFELSYSSNGELFRAMVNMVYLHEREYTLTFICRQALCPEQAATRDLILASFRFSLPEQTQPSHGSRDSLISASIWLPAVIIVLGAVIGYGLWPKRIRRQ